MSIATIGQDLKDINGLAESTGNRVMSAIRQAAQKTGVDFSYLVQKAQTESSMNPAAKAKSSSATGLYQFVDQTWLDTLDKHAAEMGRTDLANAIQRTSSGKAYVADPAKRQEIMDLRKDPVLSACMAAKLTQDNANCLKAQLGDDTKVGGTELYLAHFLGAGGASDLLEKLRSNPNAPAASILPNAAAANHNVFYTAGGRAKSVQEVYDHFAAKFGGKETPALANNNKVDLNATGDAAQALATEMVMGTLGVNGGSQNSFAAFTGNGSNDNGNSGSPYPNGYQPVAANHLSADGKIYQFGGNPPVDSNSLFYTMWLVNKSEDSKNDLPGI